MEAFFSKVKECAQIIVPRDNIVKNLIVFFFSWEFSENVPFHELYI